MPDKAAMIAPQHVRRRKEEGEGMGGEGERVV